MRTILGLALAVVCVLAVLSCSLFGPSDEDVRNAYKALARATESVTLNGNSTSTPNANGGYDFVLTGSSGVTMTYSTDSAGAGAFTATITIDSFVDSQSGYTISGSLTYVVNETTLEYTGEIAYAGGPVKSLSCDYLITINADGTQTWEGTLVANGTKTYDVAQLLQAG
jgi:hypothetical protein